jgi:hypothetical protein
MPSMEKGLCSKQRRYGNRQPLPVCLPLLTWSRKWMGYAKMIHMYPYTVCMNLALVRHMSAYTYSRYVDIKCVCSFLARTVLPSCLNTHNGFVRQPHICDYLPFNGDDRQFWTEHSRSCSIVQLIHSLQDQAPQNGPERRG